MSITPITTAANIQAYFPGITFSTATKPTLAEINNWIAQATALVLGAIRERYQIPITDTDDLKQLEAVADMYVLDNVRTVLGMNPVRQLEDGRMIPIQITHRAFMDMLDSYREGKAVLINSPGNSTYVSSGSFNSSNDITSKSKKECVQW